MDCIISGANQASFKIGIVNLSTDQADDPDAVGFFPKAGCLGMTPFFKLMGIFRP